MKIITTLMAAAGFLAALNSHATLTVTLTEDGPAGGNASGGGPFLAVTSDNGTFNTFCISTDTEFYPGSLYGYDVSSTITANNIPPLTAYITYGTAYIYNQFLLGNAAYGGPMNNATTLNDVQEAIWVLQGDVADNSEADAILSQVESATSDTLAQLEQNGNGAFGVEAMDLYDLPAGPGIDQPQLIQVPEPATVFAGLMLLLPLGLSAVRIVRRNSALN